MEPNDIIRRTVSDPASIDDAQLMRLVAQGDRAAFLQIYDRYAARVHGLALRMLGDQMTAEEVTQDSFLRLWSRATTFNPARGKLLPWLLTIARRVALDRIRIESRLPYSIDPQSQDARPAMDTSSGGDREEQRWASLRFAIADLPDEQRQAIQLAFYHSMSHSQIAEYLSAPLGTVKTRIRLGMAKLRRTWFEDGEIQSGHQISNTEEQG
jgi:RNA polymerase sigma-70 factor (ECF subfamily)